jgi:MFS transporter, CP family, cyanate transporter
LYPSPVVQSSPLFAARLVILAGVSAALHAGKLAPALPVLQQEMGITLLEAGFLLSLVQLSGMTLGWVVGLSADGIGLRRCMLWGLGVLTVVSALGALTTGPLALLVCRALEGCGFLLAVTPAPSLIRRAMGAQQLGRLMGYWGTYMPLGTALALLVGPSVIAAWGWPALWLSLSGLTAVMAVLVWRCLPIDGVPPGVECVPLASGGVPPTSGDVLPTGDGVRPMSVSVGWQWRLRETLRAPGPVLLALSFGVYSGQWVAVVGFLPSIYALAGIPAGTSALLTAAVALVNITGNAASGYLLQRGVSPQRLLAIGFGAMAGGALVTFGDALVDLLPFLSVAGDAAPTVHFAAVLVFSSVGGLIPGTLFALSVRLSPHASTVSSTVGLMQQLSATGQFVGPPVIAWVAVAMGGWQYTGWVTGACCAVGWVLAIRIGRLLRDHPRDHSRD